MTSAVLLEDAGDVRQVQELYPLLFFKHARGQAQVSGGRQHRQAELMPLRLCSPCVRTWALGSECLLTPQLTDSGPLDTL